MKKDQIPYFMVLAAAFGLVLYLFNILTYTGLESDYKGFVTKTESNFSKKNSGLGFISQKEENAAEPQVYKRQVHKKQITGRDAVSILNKSYSEEAFLKLADKYEKRKEALSEKDFLWDLSKKPQSNSDLQAYLAELRYVLLGQLEKAILQKDHQTALKHAGAFHGYAFLSIFEFKGYDDQGQVLLDLPEDLLALSDKYQKAAKKFAKNKAIKKKKRLKKAKKRSIAQNSESDIIEALQDQKLSQLAYFEDLNKEGQISEEYSENGEQFSILTEIISNMINSMKTVGIPISNPEELHEKNTDLIRDTIQNIKKFPKRYNMQSVDVKDMTDVDFPFYADRLLRSVSLKFGLLGAALNFVDNQDFLKGSGVVKIGFKVLSFFGEGLATAMGCYQGAQQMILLERFYSFMKAKREFHERSGTYFNIKESIKSFDAEKVYISKGMKQELNKAWAWGLVAGFANKINFGKTLTVSTYRAARGVIQFSTNAALYGFVKLYTSSNQVSKMIGKVGLLAGIKITDFKKFMINMFGSASKKHIPFLKKIYDGAIKLISAYPNAAGVGVNLVESGISGVFIFSSVYTRLTATRDLLSRVHLSPEVAIYLSLDSESDRADNSSFIEASRKVFHPVCHFFATRTFNLQKDTDFGTGESKIKKDIDKKIKGCLRVIAAYEGKESIKEVEYFLKSRAVAKDLNDPYGLYFGNKYLSRENTEQILLSMQQDYPSYYRMSWIAGLKSIYDIDKVPEDFFRYKDLLILGVYKEETGKLGENNVAREIFEQIVNLSTYKSTEYINTDRFTYSIERLAFRTDEFKKKRFAEKGEEFTEEDKTPASEAYYRYWNYFKSNKKITDKSLKALLSQEENNWFWRIWDGFKESLVGLEWVLEDYIVRPIGWSSYRLQVDSEADRIIGSD